VERFSYKHPELYSIGQVSRVKTWEEYEIMPQKHHGMSKKGDKSRAKKAKRKGKRAKK